MVAAGEMSDDGGLRLRWQTFGVREPSSGRCWRGNEGRFSRGSGGRGSYAVVAEDLASALRACASGRELIGMGFPEDVEIAAEVDQSRSVPVLKDGLFG